MAKLVASTADSVCRSARRKYSHDCSKSGSSHGRIFTVPGSEMDSFRFNATSRLALRSRNMNVSIITGRCGASPLLRAIHSTALAPVRAEGSVTGPGRSMPGGRRKPPRPGAYQGSSRTVSCSKDVRLGWPSQISTGPLADGWSTTFRIASRIRSATLGPERAATSRRAGPHDPVKVIASPSSFCFAAPSSRWRGGPERRACLDGNCVAKLAIAPVAKGCFAAQLNRASALARPSRWTFEARGRQP
jgi:hypothetical protein